MPVVMSATDFPNSSPAASPASSASNERLFFDRLMESLPNLVYFKDRDGHFVRINHALAVHFGLNSPDEALGKTDYDFFNPELAAQKDADEREIVRTGVGIVDKEESSSLKGGERWVLTTKLPLLGDDGAIVGTFGISRDITEARRARTLLQEQHALLRTLIEILPCRVSIKDEQGRFRLANEAFRQAWGLHAQHDITGKLLSELVSDSRTTQIAVDDRKVLDEGMQILNREERETTAGGEERWLLLSKVPLRDDAGRIQGIVTAGTDITAQKQAEAHAVESQHALANKNEQVEGELALACELQLELMNSSLQSASSQLDTEAPFHPQLASLYEPAAQLAGDFFYLAPCSPTSFAVLLCDVMGHGVKAALVTTLIRGLMANLKTESLRPSVALELLNDRLCTLLDRPAMPRFVTALSAKVDTATGEIEMANAGHPWPLLRSNDSTVRTVGQIECDPALGLIRGATYASTKLQVQRGNQLLFFSDGIIEETNPSEEEFGLSRLSAALSATTHQHPADVMADLALTVRSFSRKSWRRDDYCALLARF